MWGAYPWGEPNWGQAPDISSDDVRVLVLCDGDSYSLMTPKAATSLMGEKSAEFLNGNRQSAAYCAHEDE